ncbi:ATP-dependent protease [Pikeienuella piscinae]|uniref:ATP-dependent protease n=1 Tax=Pikeienuella piscinae TaxID=2748098 RepID=A0A7L5C0D4_9RHOB|nr:LON peptidase substrate-binding domain-containing protein [Pikeienuella piscinae]QIE56843.1 ATP-dependent protease [Pikeienuella piscinae]
MARHFGLADLPDTLPIFPISEALLLPRGRLPLNVFEPRYLAMFDDALKTGRRLVGMIQPAGDGDPPALRDVGCAGRIVSFSETEDGRYLVVLAGICRFSPAEELDGFTPYRRVRPDWSRWRRDLGPQEADDGFDRPKFLFLLKRYFSAAGLSTDWDSLKEADEEMLVNSLAMLCPFSAEEKQALLEAEMLGDRRASLIALMEFAIASHGEDGSLQ